jgi:hypothetical protein
MRSIAAPPLAMIALVALAAPSARSATVYRWTDANGTVHFGDAPPAHGGQATAEDLPDAPTPAPAPARAADEGRDAMRAAVPSPQGPARVVLTDQKAEPVSGDVQSFHGKVKNEGGAEARDVTIEIVVTEPTQGDECLHDRIDVEPSTLAPGMEVAFEARFHSPCFHGETQADLRVEWR